MSKGNRQKVALVAALAAEVELLVLDEPTSGLDPLMETVFQECIAEAKAAGRSVLLSSHILAEVEKLCDTVTIIRSGRAVQSGMLAELRHLTRTTITASIESPPGQLAGVPGVHDLQMDHDVVTFDVDHNEIAAVVQALGALGVRSLNSAAVTRAAPPAPVRRRAGLGRGLGMTTHRESLTATGDLVRFALRRDRVKLPIWVAGIGLGMLYAVTALPTVYSTPEERQVRANLMDSPAATMMSGPGYGLDNYTLGAMITNEMVLWLAVPAAMMSIFLVIRHTRAEEETGRAELIRSAVVGRHAAPVAALIVALIAKMRASPY